MHALIPGIADMAADLGEGIGVVLLGLAVISALRIVPYHIWKKSHYLMGSLFLIAVFHTFFSSSPFVAGGLIWWMLLLTSTLGLVGWFAI